MVDQLTQCRAELSEASNHIQLLQQSCASASEEIEVTEHHFPLDS